MLPMLTVFFVAFFVQSMAGFGSALVAMPFLILLLGIDVAAPLFIAVAQTAGVWMLWRYRRSFQARAVAQMLLGAVLMIPLGTLLAQRLPEAVVLRLLGGFLVLYAGYGLLGAPIPTLRGRLWPVVMGAASGLLHGAYNTGGPPLVLFGNARGWEPFVFKCNLAVTFNVMGVLVIASHALQGHFTMAVFNNYLLAMPIVGLGMLLGFQFDGVVNPHVFRRLVQVLLLAIGMRLLLG